jgi:cell division protein FtsX
MIFSTKLLPFPWRGMILTGVAAALAWAVLEIGYQGLREVILTARHTERG